MRCMSYGISLVWSWPGARPRLLQRIPKHENSLRASLHRAVLCPAFLSNAFFLMPSSRCRKKLQACNGQLGSHSSPTGSSSRFRICQPQALQRGIKHSLLSEGCIGNVSLLKHSVSLRRGFGLASVAGRKRVSGLSPNAFTVSVEDDCNNSSAGPSPFVCNEDLMSDDREGSEEQNVDLSDDDGELERGAMQLIEDDDRMWDVKTKTKGELESGLYLVGTPIGNLEDITLRALRVLKSATCILAEDTRHSAKLLRHYGIRTPTLSYHKFNEYARRGELIRRLQWGEVLALISDAGMPGISDPGSELVKACVEANVQVFPIPGPSAALTALVASGLPTDEFSFVGFLSAQASLRKERLFAAAKESATQIFYVPPHKLCRVLDDFISAFGSSRRCAVAREMTKLHEEFWRSTLEEAKAEFEVRHPRGELTLIVEGLPKRAGAYRPTEEELRSRLQVLMDAGKSPSKASKLVAEETSARRNTVYSLALKISRRSK